MDTYPAKKAATSKQTLHILGRTALPILTFTMTCFAARMALADTISLYGTGISNSGLPILPGGSDPHYTVTGSGAPAVVLSSLWGNWMANDANSQWIGWADAGYPGSYGTWTFRTTFDLTGYDFGTASLSGAWAVDNSGYVRLNGQNTGVIQGEDYGIAPSLNAFNITSGFVSGLNTLDFVCTFPDGYDALRVGNLALTVYPVPEPAGLLPVVLTVFAAALRRRRA